MKEVIDLRSNGPKPERREEIHIIEQELSAADIMKLAYIAAGTVLTGLTLILAYAAGVMIMALGIVGLLVFLWMMIRNIG